MSPKPIRDMAASVKQRLLNLARERGEEFNFLLSRYAVERLLFRLSRSDHRQHFVLKGAMLFHLRSMQLPHRPTRDLDLLGTGSPDIARLEQVLRDVCQGEVPDDGLTFLEGAVHGERIKDADEYQGIRLHLEARMGSARIPLQVDVGFGDAVTPPPREERLATLLDFPAPTLLVYPWETVVAEKLQAIVELGLDNSRMKDYFDLHYLADTQSFDGTVLAKAVRAAFERRDTPLPRATPVGLTPEFGTDQTKRTQWEAFLRKMRMEEGAPSLDEVVAKLQSFLMSPATGASFGKVWPPGGPWQEK